MTERADVSVDWADSPRIVEVASTEIINQDLHDTLRSNTLQAGEGDLDNIDDDPIIDSAGKEELGGGVKVGITSTLLNGQVAFFPPNRETPLQTGTCDTADANGTTLEDTTATFVTNGVGRGDAILNWTDKSFAEVVSVESETSLTHRPLSGGTNDDWSISDEYSIFDIIQCETSGGNLVAVDGGGADISPIFPTLWTQVVRTSSSSASLQELIDIQFTSFDNASVWVDPNTSYSGTAYPVGTTRQPVNNSGDAQLIADERGLFNLTFRGNTTVASTHSNMKFWGRSPRTTQITIDSGATLSGCEFELCLLSGDLGTNGSSYFITVALKNVTGIFGHLEGCVLREGTNTLSTPNGFVMLNRCAAVSAVNPGQDIPILDLNGSGRVASRSLDGEIIFQNKSSGNDCSLDLDGAVVTLDSTITAGTWRFSGVGTVVDNSGGTAVIDVSDLVSPASVTDHVWDELLSEHVVSGSAGLYLAETHGQIRRAVFINTEEATNGNGYQQTPFNNWSDAVDEAEVGLLQTLYLEADATVDRNLFNFEILGLDFPQIDLAGFDFKNTIIRECDVTGAQGTGNSPLLLLTCNMTNISSFNGSCLTVTAVGSIGIADGAFVLINGLVPFVGGASITLNMQNGAAGSNANFQNLSGEFTLTNCDHASDVASLYFLQGKLTIDATCIAGNVVVGGNVELIDNSGVGCTVVTNAITSEAVWDAQVADHEIAGSFGERVGKKLLDFVRFIALK